MFRCPLPQYVLPPTPWLGQWGGRRGPSQQTCPLVLRRPAGKSASLTRRSRGCRLGDSAAGCAISWFRLSSWGTERVGGGPASVVSSSPSRTIPSRSIPVSQSCMKTSSPSDGEHRGSAPCGGEGVGGLRAIDSVGGTAGRGASSGAPIIVRMSSKGIPAARRPLIISASVPTDWRGPLSGRLPTSWWDHIVGSFRRSSPSSTSSSFVPSSCGAAGCGGEFPLRLALRAWPGFPPFGPGFSSTSPQVRRVPRPRVCGGSLPRCAP